MKAAYLNNLYGSYGRDPLNNVAFLDRLQRYQLRGVALNGTDKLDARGNRLGGTPADVDTLRARGLSVWAYIDPDWDTLGPLSLASQLLEARNTYAPNGEPLALCGDVETHDTNYVIAWAYALRNQIEASRRIIWTLEPGQGGWFTLDLVNLINSDPALVVLPQQFKGDMTTWGTVEQVRADITSRGVNPQQVKVIVNAQSLTPTTALDGCAYTFELLP